MSSIQRSASNPKTTLKTQSHTTLEPLDASTLVDYSLVQLCGWMPISPGVEESRRPHDHKEIHEAGLCERTHDTNHSVTPAMSKRPVERKPRPIQESKSSKEPSSSSCKAPTVDGKATSPGALSSSPKIDLSQDSVNGVISEFLEFTANLRNARNDCPRSVLGKRRGFEDDEENVEIEKTSKRRRTGSRDSSPEDHTTNLTVWRSIPSRETIVSSSTFIAGGSPTSRQHPNCHQRATSQADGIVPTKLSVLPFHWAEEKRDPLANTTSPSLNLWLYDAAWTALHAYRELVNCGSTAESVSEARESMYLAWSTWSEARVEPPTLLWLYHTGHGLDSEGRYTIARAMNFDGADKNLTESIRRWIEKGSHPLAQIQDLPGPCSSVEATENRMPRIGNPKALVPVPEEMIADGKLPNWARCCRYSNSKASLEAHLAQNPAHLKKKQATTIIKMLFDTDGNERFSVDKERSKNDDLRRDESLSLAPRRPEDGHSGRSRRSNGAQRQ